MNKIAVLTRTSNRPNYFQRCYDSVLKQDNCEHYVIYDNPKDLKYLKDKDCKKFFVKREEYKDENPHPASSSGRRVSHALYFNDIYSKVKEDWIYHLDDDNYLLPNAFEDINPEKNTELIIVSVNHILGILPRNLEEIILGQIDTACFIIKKSLAERVKWDGWDNGDFRYIYNAEKESKKTERFNKVVAVLDALNHGKRNDISK